jgi:hypothetical protein
MLAQAFSSIIIALTQASCYSYYFLTAGTLQSDYAQVVAVFIFQFGNILLYMNYTKSFYIYTLTSSLYRNIFYRIIQNYYRKILQTLRLRDEQQMLPITVRYTKNPANVQLADQGTVTSEKK